MSVKPAEPASVLCRRPADWIEIVPAHALNEGKAAASAIVSAGVVGWSRLMGEDEAGTLATLKRHRASTISASRAFSSAYPG